MSEHSDLHVTPISDALDGFHLDVVIGGSIGAVESVRFIRALRRLGANVYPYLTAGGAQFITETSLAWAAAHPVVTGFEGTASHLAQRDAVIVAPASANLVAKIALGICDTPGSTLVASYMGQGKPVLLMPNMHDSLWQSPQVAANLKRLQDSCVMLEARREEGKQKFPEPKILADRVAHALNRASARRLPKTLITMGTTRGYIDAVRYISNYSSGSLGTHIAHELYRQGAETYVVTGPCPIQPDSWTQRWDVETNQQMLAAAQEAIAAGCEAGVFAASVLDFIPQKTIDGKIRSDAELDVAFTRSEKIIAHVQPRAGLKVGFKLEHSLNETRAREIAQDYMPRYNLSLMILNELGEVDATAHTAYVYQRHPTTQKIDFLGRVNGKQKIARLLVQNFLDSFVKGHAKL